MSADNEQLQVSSEPRGRSIKDWHGSRCYHNELLEQEGLVTAEQGKGFYVNAQDSEMLIEQHLRKVEASLTEAIAAARIAGLSDDELKNMLDALLMVQD